MLINLFQFLKLFQKHIHFHLINFNYSLQEANFPIKYYKYL